MNTKLHMITPNGQGLPVLALHSLGLSAASWTAVAKAEPLDRGFFAIDQLGHGTLADINPTSFELLVSSATEALMSMAAPCIHLVGHSLGGAVAAHLATGASRSKIASLSLVATPFAGLATFRDRAYAVADGNMDAVAKETLSRWFSTDDAREAKRAAHGCLHNMTPKGFDAAWKALAEFEGFDALPGPVPPTQICSFEDDRSTPPDIGARIAETLSQNTGDIAHHIIIGAGHMGVLTHPVQVATCLSAHWVNVENQLKSGSEA
ncbi:alpha/beta fold hydrolase [Celeribacter sp.]|uniref:alpha/beta fold hydrolase n=1 Tax=Celeribacter sp. TaxID=1890673 RepID=UPI003A92D488